RLTTLLGSGSLAKEVLLHEIANGAVLAARLPLIAFVALWRATRRVVRLWLRHPPHRLQELVFHAGSLPCAMNSSYSLVGNRTLVKMKSVRFKRKRFRRTPHFPSHRLPRIYRTAQPVRSAASIHFSLDVSLDIADDYVM